MTFEQIVPFLTLLLGFVLSFVAEMYRKGQDRKHAISDGLRNERATSYRAFLRAAHDTSTRLGWATAGHPQHVDGQEREVAIQATDKDVVPRLLELEILASAATLKNAREMREGLRDMRDKVVTANVVYRSDEYNTIYKRYQNARAAFLVSARDDVVAVPS